MAKRRRRTIKPAAEPQRVPKAPVATAGERAGAGCLGLLVLPWFLTSLFGAFVSAGLPLEGFTGIIAGAVNLALFVPFVIVLGSISVSALSRALGSNEPIQIAHNAAAGVGLSAGALFLISTLTMVIGGGLLPVLALCGTFALLAAIAVPIVRSTAKAKPQKQRRKMAGAPKAPWAHPLARTEQTNLYAEALADEFNVVAILAAAALSIVVGNPMPLLAAGGLELMWLAFAPDTQWFRARVDRKHQDMAAEQAQDIREEQEQFLASDQVDSHRQMLANVERAREALTAAGFDFDEHKMQRAVDHHLWMMQLENYYSDLDVPTRVRELETQVHAAKSDVEGVDGRMGEALKTRLDVLRRRLAQARATVERQAEVTDRRRMLEETMMLVTESALAGSARFDEIDDVLDALAATEEVVLDLHDADDALEAEIEAAHAASIRA